MQEQIKSVADAKTLQQNTFFGKEKKGLPYIIATMNMIFHGVAAPNIIRGNTLAENLAAVQERDRKHVILANPPFGGSDRDELPGPPGKPAESTGQDGGAFSGHATEARASGKSPVDRRAALGDQCLVDPAERARAEEAARRRQRAGVR